jgi:hypothetical protein
MIVLEWIGGAVVGMARVVFDWWLRDQIPPSELRGHRT